MYYLCVCVCMLEEPQSICPWHPGYIPVLNYIGLFLCTRKTKYLFFNSLYCNNRAAAAFRVPHSLRTARKKKKDLFERVE